MPAYCSDLCGKRARALRWWNKTGKARRTTAAQKKAGRKRRRDARKN